MLTFSWCNLLEFDSTLDWVGSDMSLDRYLRITSITTEDFTVDGQPGLFCSEVVGPCYFFDNGKFDDLVSLCYELDNNILQCEQRKPEPFHSTYPLK